MMSTAMRFKLTIIAKRETLVVVGPGEYRRIWRTAVRSTAKAAPVRDLRGSPRGRI